MFLPTLGFSITLEDLKALSNKDVRTLQLSLAQLGFEAGYADGVAGRKTFGAVSSFVEANKLDDVTLKSTLKKLHSTAKAQRRKEIIHFYDDFSSKSLRFYELSPQGRPNAGKAPYSFSGNSTEGTHLKISTVGLKGKNIQDKGRLFPGHENVSVWQWEAYGGDTTADKFEVAIDKGRVRSIQDRPIWIGFRIKQGAVFETHRQSWTNFFQIKQQDFGMIASLQISHQNRAAVSTQLKNLRGEEDWLGSMGLEPRHWGHPPVPYDNLKHFRTLEPNSDSTPLVRTKSCEPGTAFSKFGTSINEKKAETLPRLFQTKPLISSNKWTTYKVGILHTYDETGFIKNYQDDQLVYQYCGVTKETDKNDREVAIRLGMYRSFPQNVFLNQELLYDDFTVVGSKRMLDAYLGIRRKLPNTEY